MPRPCSGRCAPRTTTRLETSDEHDNPNWSCPAMCGCCTVLVDGTAVSGCLYLAAFVDGAEVTTVEHLADGDKLSPVQEAFIEAGAFQCGYCTPGFLLMATQLLDAYPDPDEDQ